MAVIYTKTAVNCPAPQYATESDYPSPSAAFDSGMITTPLFSGFDPAEKPQFRPKLDKNVAQSKLTTISGSSSVYGIVFGLDITSDESTATVSAGQAQIGGAVELLAETDVTLSVGLNRLWLYEDGTLTNQLDTLAAPSGAAAIYLGLVTVEMSSSGALDVDRSGVFFVRGEARWRRTADTTTPGDSPADTIAFWHRCDPKLQVWDGMTYTTVGDGTNGSNGLAATLFIAPAVTLAAGSDATAENLGDETNAILLIGIPAGLAGNDGPGATCEIGTVTTLSPGDPATVVNVGTDTAAIFDFGIPAGEPGEDGEDALPHGDEGKILRASSSNGSDFDLALEYEHAIHGTLNRKAVTASQSVNWTDGVETWLYLTTDVVLDFATIYAGTLSDNGEGGKVYHFCYTDDSGGSLVDGTATITGLRNAGGISDSYPYNPITLYPGDSGVIKIDYGGQAYLWDLKRAAEIQAYAPPP